MLFQRIAPQMGEGSASAGNRGGLGYSCNARSANARSVSRRMIEPPVDGDEGHSGSFDKQWNFVERSGPNRSPAA